MNYQKATETAAWLGLGLAVAAFFWAVVPFGLAFVMALLGG